MSFLSLASASLAQAAVDFDLLHCQSLAAGRGDEERTFVFERSGAPERNQFSWTEKVTIRVSPESEKVSYALAESRETPKEVAFQRQSLVTADTRGNLIQFRGLAAEASVAFSIEFPDQNPGSAFSRAVLVQNRIPTELECRVAKAAVVPEGRSFLSGIGIDLGVSRAQHHKNGVWFQKGFPYSLDMTSGTVSIYYRIGDHWRVGYTYLGKYSSDAMAITSDALYDTRKYECKLGPGNCPMGHFYGDGKVQGLDFSYKTASRKGFFLEGGLFVFWPTWTIHVDDYHSPEDGTVYNGLSYEHKTRIQFSPMASVGYQYKNTAVVLNCRYGIKALGDWVTAIYNGSACRVTARYEFK